MFNTDNKITKETSSGVLTTKFHPKKLLDGSLNKIKVTCLSYLRGELDTVTRIHELYDTKKAVKVMQLAEATFTALT